MIKRTLEKLRKNVLELPVNIKKLTYKNPEIKNNNSNLESTAWMG
jgi:hypothetical protein